MALIYATEIDKTLPLFRWYNKVSIALIYVMEIDKILSPNLPISRPISTPGAMNGRSDRCDTRNKCEIAEGNSSRNGGKSSLIWSNPFMAKVWKRDAPR